MKISHIIIEGCGDKAFCAGGDVVSIVESQKRQSHEFDEFFREEYKLNYLISTLEKPYIALIDGITMGGGVGLSVHGRYRVATERTIFSMPENKLGFFTDVGGGYFLPRLTHTGLGLFLALTGYRVRGLDNIWAGIATHFVESKNIQELKDSLIQLKFTTTNTTVQKRAINQSIRVLLSKFNIQGAIDPPSDIGHVMDHIANIFVLFENNQQPVTIRQIFVKLFNLYQNPQTDPRVIVWAERCCRSLFQMSPKSLQVTLRQLQLGSNMSLAEDMQMEFRLAHRLKICPNFHEGVRALLVDKDNAPKWSPELIALTKDDMLDSLFAPLTEVPEWSP